MVGGRQVHTLTGHFGGVLSVAFSPNGDRVVSGTLDNHVKIWDTKTGALVSIFLGVRCRWRGGFGLSEGVPGEQRGVLPRLMYQEGLP